MKYLEQESVNVSLNKKRKTIVDCQRGSKQFFPVIKILSVQDKTTSTFVLNKKKGEEQN